MKKTLYSLVHALIIVFFLAFAQIAFAHSNGAPSGYTGSPGDGHTCTSCHGGSASPVTGYITTNIPGTGYVAGSNYTITVSFTGSGGKGFEVSPQNATGSQLGVLAPGSGSKLVGGTKYCTHSSKINGSSATWTFSWTAPAAGTGNVTFYGAFAITEATTRTEAVTVSENASQPLAVNVSATPNSLCSVGTTQLNAAASGGSGNYTYSWTSVPAGFSSLLQNPSATPAVTTKYFAHVNDGTNTVVDSVLVTVQPAPAAFAGNDTVICLPVTQILLSGTASNSTTLLWTTSGDGTFSNASNLQTTYFPGTLDKSTGQVNLTLTANGTAPCNNAVSVRHITLDPCNGIPTAGNTELKFSFWPNPTSGKITLSVNMPASATVRISVSDLTGNIRYHEQFEIQDPSLSRTLDLKNLPSGIYMVKIECRNMATVKKLVII